MDYMGGLNSIISLVSFVIFAAGVMKVFQMATTLTEIKDLLSSIKLNGAIQPPPPAVPAVQSGEEMLRALSQELDHPVNPASIEIGQKS